MELVIVIVVTLAVGICLGVLLSKWANLIDTPEEEESPFFAAPDYHPVKVLRIGRHRRDDSFPITSVNIPDTPMSLTDEQELEDTMGFLAAVKAEVFPDTSDTLDNIPVVTTVSTEPPVPARAAIEAPTWAQENVWHKSLAQLVDELEQAAYAS